MDPSGAPVDLALHALVVELLPRPDPRTLDRRVADLSRGVEPDRPHERRTDLVGQQRSRSLAEHLRVQRDLAVRGVERLAATVGLLVDRITRLDEGHHVGDRVVHDVAVTVGLQMQRLVEVHGTGRVDGQEVEIGEVALRQPRRPHSRFGGLLHLGRELLAETLLLLDRRNPPAELLGARARDLQHPRAHRIPSPSGSLCPGRCHPMHHPKLRGLGWRGADPAAPLRRQGGTRSGASPWPWPTSAFPDSPNRASRCSPR